MKKLILSLLIVASLAACKKTAPTDENVSAPHKFEVYYPGSTDTYFVKIVTYNGDGSVTLLVIDPLDRNKVFEVTTSNYKELY